MIDSSQFEEGLMGEESVESKRKGWCDRSVRFQRDFRMSILIVKSQTSRLVSSLTFSHFLFFRRYNREKEKNREPHAHSRRRRRRKKERKKENSRRSERTLVITLNVNGYSRPVSKRVALSLFISSSSPLSLSLSLSLSPFSLNRRTRRRKKRIFFAATKRLCVYVRVRTSKKARIVDNKTHRERSVRSSEIGQEKKHSYNQCVACRTTARKKESKRKLLNSFDGCLLWKKTSLSLVCRASERF